VVHLQKRYLSGCRTTSLSGNGHSADCPKPASQNFLGYRFGIEPVGSIPSRTYAACSCATVVAHSIGRASLALFTARALANSLNTVDRKMRDNDLVQGSYSAAA
jgi:hypothetical protein